MSLSVDDILQMGGEQTEEQSAVSIPDDNIPVLPLRIHVPILGCSFNEDNGYRDAYKALLMASVSYAITNPQDAPTAEAIKRDMVFAHLLRYRLAFLQNDPFADADSFTCVREWAQHFLYAHEDDLARLYACPLGVYAYVEESQRLFPGGDATKNYGDEYTPEGKARREQDRSRRLDSLVLSVSRRVSEDGKEWLWDTENEEPLWVNSRRRIGRGNNKTWKNTRHNFSPNGVCDPVYAADGQLDVLLTGCEFKKFHPGVSCAHEVGRIREIERRKAIAAQMSLDEDEEYPRG